METIIIKKNKSMDGRRKYYGYLSESCTMFLHRDGKIRLSTHKKESSKSSKDLSKKKYFTGYHSSRESICRLAIKNGYKVRFF